MEETPVICLCTCATHTPNIKLPKIAVSHVEGLATFKFHTYAQVEWWKKTHPTASASKHVECSKHLEAFGPHEGSDTGGHAMLHDACQPCNHDLTLGAAHVGIRGCGKYSTLSFAG